MSAFTRSDWADATGAMSPAQLHGERIVAARERAASFADMADLWRTSAPATAAECLKISLEQAARADRLQLESLT